METILNPILLYVLLAVGGLGMLLALPRKGISPQGIGILITIVGFGGVLIASGLRAAEGLLGAGVWFYVFSAIALGSAIRVISHPRPVYAALYFVLTVLASSSLYLLLGAEFMAFALIIIYAGAILITYLFVIMLATQAPTEEQADRLSSYDAYAREPVVAVVTGFLLLAVLTGLIGRGVGRVERAAAPPSAEFLAEVPGRVIDSLDRHGAFDDGRLVKPSEAWVGDQVDNLSVGLVELLVNDPDAVRSGIDHSGSRFDSLFQGEQRTELASLEAGGKVTVNIPAEVRVENIDRVGWDLIAGHPMALELAGVILTMAMLGAVVLARKQIELTEDEKEARARTLAADYSASLSGGRGGGGA